MELKIFKGILEKKDFEKINNFFTNINTAWFYQPKMITASKNDDRGFFSHALFNDNQITSDAYKLILPLLEKLNAGPLINIRANLNIKSDKQYQSEFHNDYTYDESLTAIYYLNKCNGYTEFDNMDRTKVYSEPNKLAIFNCKLKHRMVSQTDINRRILININFFPK
tara:strand:+ start:644 stop:1144 length:501 start_codon:yes stop_codon:yes gene_type:complete